MLFLFFAILPVKTEVRFLTREQFVLECGSAVEPANCVRGSRGTGGVVEVENRRAAASNTDSPPGNQYSSLELCGEMRPERRGTPQREACGMSSAEKQILIGSKEKRRLRMLLERGGRHWSHFGESSGLQICSSDSP